MVVRRSPFSDNPQVGVRGQRTGQRILDATREVLGRTGYHRCSVELIAREAGCSRPTFYQYFAGKEAAFAQLAAVVADELQAAATSLAPVTPDASGWSALRTWVDGYADVYDRHEAVFHNLTTAAAADPDIAGSLLRGAEHHRGTIRRRVVDSCLSGDNLDAVIDLAAPILVRTLDDASILSRSSRTVSGTLRDAPLVRPSLLDAYVDVVHRTLFGLVPEVNVHDHDAPTMSNQRRFLDAPIDGIDGPTRRSLITAARDVLSSTGFHGATVDAIVETAGVAHGTFYRYFPNKETLTRELVKEASDKLSSYFSELADLLAADPWNGDRLRHWLARYSSAQHDEMAVLRVWSEATLVDVNLLADAAPMLEWGRRRIARPLGGRGFAGQELDAMVLIALIDGVGSTPRSAELLEAAAVMIERGFLALGGERTQSA